MSLVHQLGTSVRRAEINERASEFAAVARFIWLGKGKAADSVAIARASKASDRIIAAVEKAAEGMLAGGSGGTWGSQLGALSQLSAGFIESLANVGVFDAVLPFTRRIPLGVRLAIVIGRAEGHEFAEGDIKAVSELVLANGELQQRTAVAHIIVDEELQRVTPEAGVQLLLAELRSGTASATDAIVVADLLAQVTPGTSSSDPLQDFSTLAQSILTGVGSTLVAIVSSQVAKQLAFYSSGFGRLFPEMGTGGGRIADIRVFVSDSIADTIVMFDASQVATAPGDARTTSSNSANIDMGGGTVVNMFQTNKRSLKNERTFGWELLRASAAAALTGVNYAAS